MVREAARELDDVLAKRRLRAYAMDREGFALFLYFRTATVVLRLHPDEGAVLIRHEERDADSLPESARRYPGRLLSVDGPPDDRLFTFHFVPHRGKRSPLDLVVDWVPNRRNAYAVDLSSGRVVTVLRDGPGPRVGDRLPDPDPSTRRGLDAALTPGEWEAVWSDGPAEELEARLLRNVAYLSRMNLGSIVGAEPHDPSAAYERYRTLVHGPSDPQLVQKESGAFPYPASLPGEPQRPYPLLLDAIEAASDLSAGEVTRVPTSVIAGLESSLRHRRKRVRSLERELARVRDPEEVRAEGHLLLAYLHQVPPSAESVTLTDFDGSSRTLDLDPRSSPQENAEARFEEAQKAERARATLPGRIDTERTAVDEAERLLDRIRSGDASPEELEIARRAAPARRTKGGSAAPALPYRVFRTRSGHEVRVGRGNRANDALTFQHSRPDDIWLHARHAAGAHVILRWDREDNPPARDLYEAGVLAALHSKARHSGSVPVDWTRRKYVRKPRKAPPGTVLPDRVKTVFVEPDETLAESMKVSDGEPERSRE